MSFQKTISILLGLGISIVFFYLSFRRLDMVQIYDIIHNINILPWIPLGIASYLTGHIIRGLRTKILISNMVELPLLTTTHIVVLGYAVNNILPARLGELARASLLKNRGGVSFAYSLTITILERLFDGMVMLLFLFIATNLLSLNIILDSLKIWIWVICLGTAFGFGFVLLAPSFTIDITSRLLQNLTPKLHDRLLSITHSIVNALSYIRNPKHFLTVFTISIVIWVFEAGLFLFMSKAFAWPLTYLQNIWVMTVTNLGILMPSSPGFIGTFHFFCLQALIFLGIPQTSALGYATLVHLAFYIPITLWGIGIMLSYGLEFSTLFKMSRQAKPLPAQSSTQGMVSIHQASSTHSSTPDLHPPKFYIDLVSTLVPKPQLPPSQHQEILLKITTFVYGQLQSLPQRYIALFNVGLWGFRICAFLKFGKSFTKFSPEQKHRFVSSWAYGKWTLCRQLFRPLRSTALLAYYELIDIDDSQN